MSKYCETCESTGDCHIFEYACKSGVIDKHSEQWGCTLHIDMPVMIPLDEVIEIVASEAGSATTQYIKTKLKEKYGGKDAKD